MPLVATASVAFLVHSGQPPEVAHTEQGVVFPWHLYTDAEPVLEEFSIDGFGHRMLVSETLMAESSGPPCVPGTKEFIFPGESIGLGIVGCGYWVGSNCDDDEFYVTNTEAKRIIWDTQNMELDCMCGEPGEKWARVCVLSGGMEWINVFTLHIEFVPPVYGYVPYDTQTVQTCSGRVEYSCASPCGNCP